MRVSGYPRTLSGMTDATNGIAARVRGVAAERGFTQQRIASVLGISRTSVVERYAARVPWSGAELLVLADAMGVNVARLFPEEVAA